jgi:hypothetical protein
MDAKISAIFRRFYEFHADVVHGREFKISDRMPSYVKSSCKFSLKSLD